MAFRPVIFIVLVFFCGAFRLALRALLDVHAVRLRRSDHIVVLGG